MRTTTKVLCLALAATLLVASCAGRYGDYDDEGYTSSVHASSSGSAEAKTTESGEVIAVSDSVSFVEAKGEDAKGKATGKATTAADNKKGTKASTISSWRGLTS